jgi:hypothetical protein
MSTLPPFFVTGLPRSRTAWLANFLTGEQSLCIHEGLLNGEAKIVQWLKERHWGVRRGISDSMLPLSWPEISSQFTEYKLVIVRRDPDDCWRSLVAFLDREEVRVPKAALELEFAAVERNLRLMSERCHHLAVQFEDLNETAVLGKIWNHCLPGLRFSPDRALLLQHLNIQQNVERVRASRL